MIINHKYILEQYFKYNKSLMEIATELNTYPNKIRRTILKHGKTLRDKSEAQTLALKSGKSIHPTKGKSLSLDTKNKISDGVAESWKNSSEQKINLRKQKAKDNWENLSEEDKKHFFNKAFQALKSTAKFGSKIEKFLFVRLNKEGYKVEFHKEQALAGTNFQIDLYINKLNIALEIQGPAHFIDIWGMEALKKRQAADQLKKRLILGSKIRFICICYKHRHISQKIQREAWNKLKKILLNEEYIKQQYIEIWI